MFLVRGGNKLAAHTLPIFHLKVPPGLRFRLIFPAHLHNLLP